LLLRLDHGYGTNLRATWADGKRQRLEHILSSVVTGLLQRVNHEKQQRLESQISARQRQRATERREAAQRQEAEEKRRREELKTAVDCWRYADRIRRYLATLEEGIVEGKLRIRDEQTFAKWSKWAHWYADHVDPVIHAAPLPEEIQPPVNTPLADIEFTSRAKPVIERLGIRDTDGLHCLSQDEIRAAGGEFSFALWNEVCLVLEGIGYDMAGRSYWP